MNFSVKLHEFGISDIMVMVYIASVPGEMADADYGYVGKAGGMITLYRKRDPIRTVSQEFGVEELVALIKADGKWREPGLPDSGLNESQAQVAAELPAGPLP